MKDIFEIADDLGPLKIIHVHEPSIGLKGILVIDNLAAGPSIGGLRIAPDVNLEECARLARAMTLKNAAANVPHGGGKSIIIADPAMQKTDKERLVRGFACALKNEEGYIFGPDMGTHEQAMAWVKDEIGRAVGLPRVLGGIPLDEIGITGFGVAEAAEIAIKHCDFELKGARLAVQGFGAVGKHAALNLTRKGAVLVAAADSRGTIHDPGGLDVEALVALKEQGKPLADHSSSEKLEREAIVGVDCEIWIPAARPDVITKRNVGQFKGRLIVEGANIPLTLEAEKNLHKRGVICVPDFIANAGGVICGAMEYAGALPDQVFSAVAGKITDNTALVLERAMQSGEMPRTVATELALEHVRTAMGMRRWSLF